MAGSVDATPRPTRPGGGDDPRNTARVIALRMLESQPRTRVELERALARRGIPPDATTAVLDRFAEVGLLDDAAFATAWVDSRHSSRSLGRRALANELRSRGVDAELIRDAVETVSDEDERTAARALVERRLRSMTGLPHAARQRRLLGLLARKGFGSGLAAAVVREVLAADGEADGDADGDAEALAGADPAADD